MISYPALIKYNKSDKVYHVEFIDLPGCITYGESLKHALQYAKEALSGYLESIDLRKLKIPVPSQKQRKDIHFIEPKINVAFVIWLKTKRSEKNLSQKKMASMLNIKYQSYQKYENPLKTNPTLKTIIKLQNILNEKVINF